MSLHVLDVAPRDVAAGSLGLVLGAPVPVTLAELRLDDGAGGTLVLGVLGASHAVTASAAGRTLTEQVSCDALALGGVALPALEDRVGYRLASRTELVTTADLAERAGELRATAADDPAWICGAFPGADTALTALTGTARPGGGWSWRTWHLYPGDGTGEIVTTWSTWDPAGAAP